MDIFSHGLWAAAAAAAVNHKAKKRLKIWLAALWGILPDIFTFSGMFIWFGWGLLFGGKSPSGFPYPEETELMPADTSLIFRLTAFLYGFSHSLVIFLIFFGLGYLIFKRPLWEMGGWLLHILIDIPTHSLQLFPTPFSWPLFNFKFNGLDWFTPWLMVLDYALLAIVYLYFFIRWRRLKNKANP